MCCNQYSDTALTSTAEAAAVAAATLAVGATDEGQAPATGITGAISRQGAKSGVESGGLDYLDFCMYGYWAPGGWEAMRKKLDGLRAAAEAGRQEGAVYTSPEGDQALVQPYGVKHGVYCRWVLLWQGITMAIVDRPNSTEGMAGVFVSIPSLPLMTNGYARLWHAVHDLFTAMGFVPTDSVISRVDVCVDLPGVPVNELVDAWEQGRVIARARTRGKSAVFKEGMACTGMHIGRKIMLRVYDKLRECQHDPVKLATMMERRWGGVASAATRVEFELQRDALRRRWDVKDLVDLRQKLPHIVEWLTTEWFRLTETAYDSENRNHGRATVATIWQRVQAAFAAWLGAPEGRAPSGPLKQRMNLTQLKKQMVGVATAIIAHGQAKIHSAGDVLREVQLIVREFAGSAVVAVAKKRAGLRFAGRAVHVDLAEIPF